MKKTILSLSIVALLATACGSSDADKKAALETLTNALHSVKPEVKQETVTTEVSSTDYNSTPEKVIETIQNAVKNQDFSALSNLCNDAVKSDRDAKQLCGLATDEKDRASFTEYFSTLKMDGTPTITGDKAEVNILFGKDGAKKETFKMLKIDGKWYLESF